MSDRADDETRNDRPSLRSIPTEPDFGPRYRVLGVLGKGGMGEVYRAYDTELKNEVALKVIRGDGDVEASLARFRREIALAHKVTSPNVLRVYDLNVHQGLRFLSMELVDGEDLAALLRREKQLPIERALALFRQVCLGLEAAHAQGVVHRDLKPQNVLVDREDRVRVADFGLARSIGESGLTASGAILGSPAYMSPEQVKGDPTDERSDIYSLGIMLYHLVTGEAPFRGDTPHAVMEMRLHKKAPPLRDVRADAPPYLEAIVAKCLAVAPAARYASVHDLLAALGATTAKPAARRPKWLVPALVGGIAVAAGAIAVVAWPRGGGSHEVAVPQPTATPAPPGPAANTSKLVRIIIGGFENRTQDPVFDDTLDQAVYSGLHRSKLLDPISMTRAHGLAAALGTKTDEELAAKLLARDHGRVAIMHGTVTRNGARFTISTTVTDAATHATVFDQTVDAGVLKDVMTSVPKLTSAIREAFGEHVADQERAQLGLSTSIEAVHEWALAGRSLDANDIPTALEHYKRAVSIDPEFPDTHIGLAIAYQNSQRIVDSRREFELALKFVGRLGERDRLGFVGDYNMLVTENYQRAIDSYRQSIAQWPNDGSTYNNLAIAYQASGDIKAALETGRKAAQLDPSTEANVPIYEIGAGEFDHAIADLRRDIAESSRPEATAYVYLAIASMFANHRDDAAEALAQAAKVDPSLGNTALADFAMAEGRLKDAEAALVDGIRRDAAQHLDDAVEIKQAILAELHLRRGDKAGARAAAALVAKDPTRLLQAALVQIATGDGKRAAATAAVFAQDIAPSRRAMAKLLEADALRAQGKPLQAMIAFQDALHIADSQLGHFLFARAAIEAHRYGDALNELDGCIAHRSEAAFGIDDVPTYRNIPLLYYYRAKAQDGINSLDAKQSYAEFLAMMHDPDPDDVYVADARKHAP
ncbi:MAG TPA: serine/threonine-protein kinase [Kofleriaceae bacterium]|nr:serine/threonine-protein kinase [Kofleriaceae bacterium]